jgi:hypothetical protein
MKLVAPAGEDLMGVRLMPDVPDETVPRRIENVMHRDRKLDRSKRRSRVSADPRARVDNKLANFIGNFLQVLDL